MKAMLVSPVIQIQINMNKHWLFLIFLAGTLLAHAQDTEVLHGVVSFLNASNVYVKFESTKAIVLGETLYFNETACVKVQQKSSSSVVGIRISDCELKVGDALSYRYKLSESSPPKPTIVKDKAPTLVENPTPTLSNKNASNFDESIHGKLSLADYYTQSENGNTQNRIRTQFNINADHLNNSPFSLSSYLTYQTLNNNSNTALNSNKLQLYDLTLSYENSSIAAYLGRKINPKLSVVGAIDGLQFEKKLGLFYTGAILGFRPDSSTYGFNSNLLQYGFYSGISSNSSPESYNGHTTLGIVQQTNGGAIDRRFIYFQHLSSIAKQVTLFSSMEYDIYSTIPGLNRMTNLYASLRYKVNKSANMMFSYDSRRRIIYYETYQNEVEKLLDEDLARQGARFRVNFKPTKTIWSGFSVSNRFASTSQEASKNYYAYTTFSRIPSIGGRLALTANFNQTSFMESQVFSANYGRSIFEQWYATLYFRQGAFKYSSTNSTQNQSYMGGSIQYNTPDHWSFSCLTEYSKNNLGNGLRVYVRLSKRFKSL